MNKKMIYGIIVMSTLFVVGIIIFSMLVTRKPTETTTEETVVMDEIIVETEEPTSYIEFDEDFEGFEDVNTAIVENPDILFDLIPIKGLYSINTEASTYLNAHGYADAKVITILEDSVMGGKGYPYFLCEVDTMKDSLLEVRYHLETSSFEFKIVDKFPKE